LSPEFELSARLDQWRKCLSRRDQPKAGLAAEQLFEAIKLVIAYDSEVRCIDANSRDRTAESRKVMQISQIRGRE
jgi:hypothetical protein